MLRLRRPGSCLGHAAMANFESIPCSFHRFTALSHEAGRRSGRLTRPPRSTVACARSHRPCARLQECAAPRPHRSGCALRRCRTAAPRCRKKRPPPAVRPPPSVDAAPCARWSTPTRLGFPPDRGSHRLRRRPASGRLSLGPAGFRARTHQRGPGQAQSRIPELLVGGINSRQPDPARQ